MKNTQKIKSQLAVGMICLTFFSGILSPRPSHAIIGGVSGNIPLMIAGGVLFGLPIVAGSIAIACAGPRTEITIGGLPLLIGIILLDEKTQAWSFQEINSATQMEFGFSDSEVLEFNSDLPKLNAMMESIDSGITPLPSDELKLEHAKALWGEMQGLLSSSTQDTLKKIGIKLAES